MVERLPKEPRLEGPEIRSRRVGHDVALSAVPPAGAEALIDAPMAFEPGTVLHREQPARQPTRAPLRPGPAPLNPP